MLSLLESKNINVRPFSLSEAHGFQPLKPELHKSNLHDLFSYIWAQDFYNYEHPRYRIYVALSILLYLYLGLYLSVALNGGLHYEEVTILITRHNNYCYISKRERKNTKN
jgi:hypothetical protein